MYLHKNLYSMPKKEIVNIIRKMALQENSGSECKNPESAAKASYLRVQKYSELLLSLQTPACMQILSLSLSLSLQFIFLLFNNFSH